MKATDLFYDKQEEPFKSFFLALRDIILLHDENISESVKYGMLFFSYKGKMFCYFWKHKKYNQPYIGWVEGRHLDHPDLIIEKRSRIKIFLMDPDKDIPVRTVKLFLKKAITLYTSGLIQIRAN